MREITLKVFWSKKEKDFMVAYPNSSATGGYVIGHLVGKRTEHRVKMRDQDGKINIWDSDRLLWTEDKHDVIEHDFIKEMELWGFDTKTLKFSIKLDVNKLESRFPQIYNQLSPEQKHKLKIK